MKNNSAPTYEAPASPYAGRVGITYSRVSSKGQKADAQELRCKNFLAAAGVPFDTGFTDKFTGGGDFMQRPAMRELLAYIDASPKRRFVVVFDDLKRFARDTEFHIQLRYAFKRRNVVLACLNYNFDDSPEGRFAETVLAAQGELERHQNRRQTMDKMKARLDRGYWTFSSKKGYTIKKNRVHGKLCVPNAEGKLIAEALEGFASGRFVRRIDVCKFLVERGLWRRQRPVKYLDRVLSYMRDPFYYGDIEYPAWGVQRRPGQHKPLISQATFDAVQARLGTLDSAKRIRRDISEDFPLRGLLVCAECQGHLTAAKSKGRSKHYAYYYCQRRDCARYAAMFRKDDVEEDFAALVERNQLRPGVEEVLTLVFERSWQTELAGTVRTQEERGRAHYELKEHIKDYARLARETTSAAVRQTYEEQIEASAQDLERLEEEEAKVTDLSTPYRTALGKATELLKSPLSTWYSVDPMEKQRLFFLLFEDKLEYSKIERYRTGEKLSSMRLFEEFIASNSPSVHSAGKSSNRRGRCADAGQASKSRTTFDSVKLFLERFWAYYQSSSPLREALARAT